MRTTLTLDDDVAVRIERLRKERDASLKEIVNGLLRKALDDAQQGPGERPKVDIRVFNVGSCALPNVDKIADVLAFAEGEDYR